MWIWAWASSHVAVATLTAPAPPAPPATSRDNKWTRRDGCHHLCLSQNVGLDSPWLLLPNVSTKSWESAV